MSVDPGVWIAAILTLAIFSFLYKDNPVYKFAEHLLVGVSAGYYLTQYTFSAVYKKLIVPVFLNGEWILIFGGLLGLLMFFRMNRKTEWISRYAIAFYVVAWSGYVIPSILQARVLVQAQGTIPVTTGSIFSIINAWLIMIGVLCILIYFYFSMEHKGVLLPVSQVGIFFLMLGFGASFGYTIMGRITLLIGRFQFLMGDWLGIIEKL
ncbi:MAG: hypothetical protein KJ970_16615 [Candidatus Eisenbacteria bacterium]|uniref:Uncharacterized protein n=1 Tax=Eiseniibacteriota bacterium TaxID=2212470 RepID=A0A948RWW8_UNCEI|nr:hypothetical protein [Candidatus Eisenbacteria bacterium]MBU1950489.1 hypothetical protein [Candidatus Eisenbacteria bacterium]MBU2692540.1 hypothetical protein [Candidatus Eisenbacteria bacterium]